jgi:hypothetical protein
MGGIITGQGKVNYGIQKLVSHVAYDNPWYIPGASKSTTVDKEISSCENSTEETVGIVYIHPDSNFWEFPTSIKVTISSFDGSVIGQDSGVICKIRFPQGQSDSVRIHIKSSGSEIYGNIDSTFILPIKDVCHFRVAVKPGLRETYASKQLGKTKVIMKKRGQKIKYNLFQEFHVFS